ncbi:ST3 beta-galactoside alpha-2,3-sialyltransferase 8 [Alosa pseudoharengus]|uniref:ST3 beta-galactoside alpha-2,3-sialyltransferase 8 n=1 Tax=Alosa pseudoharengus TaxID=34774 RepID=UPI003F8B6CAF
MILKKKAYLVALLCGILFFMILTHTIQKGTILPGYMVAFTGTTERMAAATSRTPTPPPTTTKTTITTTPGRAHTCSCPTCVADPGVSKWFDQHFDPKQQPYLIKGENQMDSDSLKWWMGLQRASYDVTLEQVIHKMFEVFSSPPADWPPQRDRCRSCAVVGNSGNLLGSHYGATINANTVVIRMNKATTHGYEEDVGNKTTHHIMYPESAVDLSPGVHLVLLPFKQLDLQWLTSAMSTGEITKTYMRVKNFIKADKDKVIVVNPAFFKYTHEQWNDKHGRYPSTGMLAIIFALHLCDEVSVFGYGANEMGHWHHYWENNKNGGAFRKTGVHNADFETEVINKLHEDGKIRLHKR